MFYCSILHDAWHLVGPQEMLFLVLNVSLPSNSYTSSYKDISEIEDLHFGTLTISLSWKDRVTYRQLLLLAQFGCQKMLIKLMNNPELNITA